MKNIYTAFVISAFLLFLPFSSYAAEFRYPLRSEDSNTAVVVLKDEVVNNDLYIVGKDVVVSGTVQGNVFAAGGTVTVNGDVKGDVVALGGTVNVAGKVSGSVHTLGGEVTLEAQSVVEKDVSDISAEFTVAPNAIVGRDLIFLGSAADMRGKVGGYVLGRGEKMNLSGSVGGYADLMGNEIAVAKEADISGNLNVQTRDNNEIGKGAHVGGTRTITVMPFQKQAGVNLMRGFWKGVTLFLIALLFVRMFPNKADAAIREFHGSVGSNALWGILAFFATIPVAIFLLFSIVGFPIGIGVLLAYFVALYVAAAVASLFIGNKILHAMKQVRPVGSLDALVGVFIMWLVALVPVIGGLAEAALLVYSLGVLLRIERRAYGAVRNADLTTHVS